MFAIFKRKKLVFCAIAVFFAVGIFAAAISRCAPQQDAETTDINDFCISFLKDKNVKMSNNLPQSIDTVLLPRDFSAALAEYNDLQKRQGFDLSAFAGKTVLKYTYGVDSDERSDIVAVVFVYGRQIIGGDIHCIGTDGYMTGFDGEAA